MQSCHPSRLPRHRLARCARKKIVLVIGKAANGPEQSPADRWAVEDVEGLTGGWLQVYKGMLKSGEEVAVKVQRPYVLETVTVDLFIIR